MTSKNRKINKKSKQSSEFFFKRRHFNDFDTFSESIHDWDLGFQQLDRGAFKGDLLQLKSGPVLLSRFSFNRRLELRGTTHQRFRTFGIPIEIRPAMTWRGKIFTRRTVQCYPPNSELEGTAPPGFTTFTLSISEERLAELDPVLGLPMPQELPRAPESFQIDISELQRFHQTLQRVNTLLAESPSKLSAPWLRDTLEFEIPQQLLALLSMGHPANIKPAPSLRSRALKQALAYIREHADDPPVIREICRDVGVSQKTLEHAFLDHFGGTPKSYLQAYRLNMVRKNLRQADPHTTKIADIANRWGFWHMGQFAKDYRTFFGELPSESLKRPERLT